MDQPGGGTAPARAGEAGATTIAARPSSGHLYSQMPQPMQRLAIDLRAREIVTVLPSGAGDQVGRQQPIALSGTGHISWQTTHGVSAAQGRQRFRSITATPMTCSPLLLQRERGDRARGADLAAGVQA